MLNKKSQLITLSFLSLLLVFSCTNKTPIADKPPIPQPQILSPTISLYVGTEDGLRIRDIPGLSGTIIGNLFYGEQITEITRDGKTDMIDGITDQWRLIRSGETEGWVFGGYLSPIPPPPAGTADDVEGAYSVQSIKIIKQENMRIDNFLENIPNFEYTLTRITHGTYAFRYPDLWFSRNTRYDGYDNVGYKTATVYLPPRETYRTSQPPVFLDISGESGGSGTYIDFYYLDGKIKVDYKCSFWSLKEEDGDLIATDMESLEFEMILSK